MLIEIHTFRLAGGADEAAFLEADRLVQAELASHHAGFIRRTTAQGADGGWAVVALWQGEAEADRAAGNPAAPAALTAFSAFIDPALARVERFHTLD